VVRGCRSELGGWELGCVALTGNAAQCLATYSPRCVLNEFRLLHINYHGLAKRQSQAQPFGADIHVHVWIQRQSPRLRQRRRDAIKNESRGKDQVAGGPGRLVPVVQWDVIGKFI